MIVVFLTGFVLAALVGILIVKGITRKYSLLVNNIEKETSNWQQVELPVTCPLDKSQEYSALGKSVCDLTAKARSLAQEIQLTSQQVQAASGQMAASVQATSDINSTFHQMQSLAMNLKVTEELLEKDFSDSERAVQESNLAVGEVTGSISEITSSNSILKDQIKTLQESVEQVRQISEVIGGISEQTKLLALNAAIEAARAGEHGRGFGVVAEEIGKLSDRTADAVKQTTVVLHGMKRDVEMVVSSINNSLDTSGFAATQVHNVQDVFRQNFELIKKVNHTVKESFNGVNDKLQQMSALLESRNRDLEAINYTGEMMAGLAQELEQVVNKNQLTYTVKTQAASRVEEIKEQLTQCASNNNIFSMNQDVHRDALVLLKNNNPDLEAIWSNDATGRFLYSMPPAALANAKVRDWWQRAMEGESYVSPVYISAITRQPCLTVSVPIFENKRIIGVLGADIRLN